MADDTDLANEQGKSWRDILKVHPAADMLPLLGEAEKQELGKDLLATGMAVPIVVWYPSNKNNVHNIDECILLDGRNRLDALEAVGLEIERLGNEFIYVNKKAANGKEVLIDKYYSDQEILDPYAFVISANIHRRHLTTAQKSDLIVALLKERPERSDRETAKIAHVDHTTVAAKRRKLESTGEIHQLKTRTGADGRTRSTAKAKPPEVRQRLEKAAAAGMVSDAEVVEEQTEQPEQAAAPSQELTVVNGELSPPLPLDVPGASELADKPDEVKPTHETPNTTPEPEPVTLGPSDPIEALQNLFSGLVHKDRIGFLEWAITQLDGTTRTRFLEWNVMKMGPNTRLLFLRWITNLVSQAEQSPAAPVSPEPVRPPEVAQPELVSDVGLSPAAQDALRKFQEHAKDRSPGPPWLCFGELEQMGIDEDVVEELLNTKEIVCSPQSKTLVGIEPDWLKEKRLSDVLPDTAHPDQPLNENQLSQQ